MYTKANADFIQLTSDYENLEVNFQYGKNEGSSVSFVIDMKYISLYYIQFPRRSL